MEIRFHVGLATSKSWTGGVGTPCQRWAAARNMGSSDVTKKLLKASSRKVLLANEPGAMKGRRVGIEASGWLHRGCKRNPQQTCNHGVSQEAVLYVTTRINAVLGEGGNPILVFDGDRRYPAKAETHQARRKTADDAQAVPAKDRTLQHWRAMATPQEELLQAVMSWCVQNCVPFVVSPYEADHQLVGLYNDGQIDTILVSSNDSDMACYGGCDCLYDYDATLRSVFWVKLLEQLLVPLPQPLPGGFSFEGWTYDRFLVLCLICGHDYLANIPGCGLVRCYQTMSRDALPACLCPPPGLPHPPIPTRPAVWRTETAIRAYANSLITSKLPPADQEPYFLKLLFAYRAVRHHPIFHIASPGDMLDRASMTTTPALPLESLPAHLDWHATLPGLRLHGDDVIATKVLRGDIVVDTLVPRVLVADAATGAADIGDETPGSAGEDDEAAEGVAAEAPDLSLDNYEEATGAQLLAWLIAHGVDPYANTPITRLRQYVSTLLRGGTPPVLQPMHPLLREMSRPATAVRVESPYLHRGAELHALALAMTRRRAAAGAADGGLLSEAARHAWLPFPSVHRRADLLYCAGAKYLAPNEEPWGYAYSHEMVGQLGVHTSREGVQQPCWIFRMRVRASMRQLDHTPLLVITSTGILPAPYSECTCESGIDCSHEAVLAKCIYVLQNSASWAAYTTHVMSIDTARLPSGRPAWWNERFKSGVGGRQLPEAKRRKSLSVDEEMLEGYRAGADSDTGDEEEVHPALLAPPPPPPDLLLMYHCPLSQEDETELKTSGCLPVTSMDPGTQGMLHRLAMHFRGGMLASILRVEMGTVFAPPVPASQPAGGAYTMGEEEEFGLGGSDDEAEAELVESPPASPAPNFSLPSEWQSARMTHSPPSPALLELEALPVDDPPWEVMQEDVVGCVSVGRLSQGLEKVCNEGPASPIVFGL